MFTKLSDHAKSLHAELKSFMAEHVYPNEKTLLAPPEDGAERWARVRCSRPCRRKPRPAACGIFSITAPADGA